ncbi:hypothetical protein [Paenibacillus sp. IHBB 3054]|uniref:hypothetical protein n=1 Tax=Paenibacillus sp. IHBB 3054 TaxID=3425689 RepID=UPI003F664EA2
MRTFTFCLGITLTVGMTACSSGKAKNVAANGTSFDSVWKKLVIKYWTDGRHEQEYIKELTKGK